MWCVQTGKLNRSWTEFLVHIFLCVAIVWNFYCHFETIEKRIVEQQMLAHNTTEGVLCSPQKKKKLGK